MLFSQNSFKTTANQHGVMHKINPISIAFIEYAKTCHGTVLDIGSAYGVAIIPILLGGTDVRVIACDISKDHLEELEKQVRKIDDENGTSLFSRLTPLNQKFPDFDLEENSLDAVLASHVLPFLAGKEIEKGFNKLAKFLKPGGILYITSYSIYNKVMQKYIPDYEKRKESGDPWPGELEDASLYWDKENPLTAILPKRLNHLEPCLIKTILQKNNFKIKYLDFLSLTDEIPGDMKLNGREAMGLIAKKK